VLNPKFHAAHHVTTQLDTLSSPCILVFGAGKNHDVLCRACWATARHARHAATHTAYYKRKCSTHSLAANSSANVLL